MLIGSPTNGSASCGRVAFPNLGYRKDAFLEPSLVSNNFSSSSQTISKHSNSQHQQLSAMASSNNKQSSSLSAHAPDFVPFGDLSGPGVPGDPAPVDSLQGSTVVGMQGSAMYAVVSCQRFSMTHIIVVFRVDPHTFVMARGDHISRPPRHHPQQGRLGGAYL